MLKKNPPKPNRSRLPPERRQTWLLPNPLVRNHVPPIYRLHVREALRAPPPSRPFSWAKAGREKIIKAVESAISAFIFSPFELYWRHRLYEKIVCLGDRLSGGGKRIRAATRAGNRIRQGDYERGQNRFGPVSGPSHPRTDLLRDSGR